MNRLALALTLLPALSWASEADYIKSHCKGVIEFTLPDRTRVDCQEAFIAWEYDYAYKWAESIGQALHYSRMTNTAPGVVLIIEKPEDCRYFFRLQKLKQKYLPYLRLKNIGDC